MSQGSYKQIPLDEVQPNTWNMNRMSAELRLKLVHGIKDLYAKAGKLPPIIVRPHPKDAGQYEIIDGFHRWDVLRTENIADHIDAFVLDVDTKTAMMLTDTLNYLRGEPDLELQARYFQKLNVDHQMPLSEIAMFVPETEEEINDIFNAYNITPIQIDVPSMAVGESQQLTSDDIFVEVKFSMSVSQAEVVERELARIGQFLGGKNVRGRALEFMAVNSSQTELANLTGEDPDADEADPATARLAKLKAKLRRAGKKKK